MIQLDSDILIDIGRGYAPAVEWLIYAPIDEKFVISGFTVMELIQGSRNAYAQRQTLRTLSRFPVVWLTPNESEQALSLFKTYRLSHGVGILDILIGYTAIINKLAIATFNRKHFSFLPGVQIVAPYDKV